MQKYSFDQLRKYTGWFHDGDFERYSISDHEMVFFLTSAQIGPEWEDEFDGNIELSNYYQIIGRLHLLEPRLISINDEVPKEFPVKNDLAYDFLDFVYVSPTRVELGILGPLSFRCNNDFTEEFYTIIAEAREIYWENLPDLKMVWKPEKKEVQEIEAFFPLARRFYKGVIESLSVGNNQLEICMAFLVHGSDLEDSQELVDIDPESIRLTFSEVNPQDFPLEDGLEYDILKIEFSSAQDVYLQVREYKKEDSAPVDVNLHAGEIVWERNPMWGRYEWPPMAEAEK